LYSELREQYGDLPDAKYFLDRLAPENPTFPGKQAPPFEVTVLGSNQKISNDTFLGKYYLIDFWAIWCPPCRVEMPNLHRVYEKYKDSNFTILSLSLDQKPEDIEKYRDENWEMPWNHAFLGRSSWGTGITRDFNVRGIPMHLLISPEGVILASTTSLSGEELDRTLARYLGTAN
jgi:thiol-disulfide isomerase/thioredoxin